MVFKATLLSVLAMLLLTGCDRDCDCRCECAPALPATPPKANAVKTADLHLSKDGLLMKREWERIQAAQLARNDEDAQISAELKEMREEMKRMRELMNSQSSVDVPIREGPPPQSNESIINWGPVAF